jgi:hypothetical protein
LQIKILIKNTYWGGQDGILSFNNATAEYMEFAKIL